MHFVSGGAKFSEKGPYFLTGPINLHVFQITISVVSSDSCKTFCSAFQLSIILGSELAYNTVQRVGQRVRNPGYSAEISAFVFLALHPFWTISLSGRRLLGWLPLHFQKESAFTI